MNLSVVVAKARARVGQIRESRIAKDWEEDLHPREGGKFTSGGGGDSGGSKKEGAPRPDPKTLSSDDKKHLDVADKAAKEAHEKTAAAVGAREDRATAQAAADKGSNYPGDKLHSAAGTAALDAYSAAERAANAHHEAADKTEAAARAATSPALRDHLNDRVAEHEKANATEVGHYNDWMKANIGADAEMAKPRSESRAASEAAKPNAETREPQGGPAGSPRSTYDSTGQARPANGRMPGEDHADNVAGKADSATARAAVATLRAGANAEKLNRDAYWANHHAADEMKTLAANPAATASDKAEYQRREADHRAVADDHMSAGRPVHDHPEFSDPKSPAYIDLANPNLRIGDMDPRAWTRSMVGLAAEKLKDKISNTSYKPGSKAEGKVKEMNQAFRALRQWQKVVSDDDEKKTGGRTRKAVDFAVHKSTAIALALWKAETKEQISSEEDGAEHLMQKALSASTPSERIAFRAEAGVRIAKAQTLRAEF